MWCSVFLRPTQISLNTVVMRGSARRGGIPITGPDLTRFTNTNDGCFGQHHLLLQMFLRQRRGWAAALKGLLGMLGR